MQQVEKKLQVKLYLLNLSLNLNLLQSLPAYSCEPVWFILSDKLLFSSIFLRFRLRTGVAENIVSV